MMETLKIWARSVLTLLFRRECLICHRELRGFEKNLCTHCLADLPLSFTWCSEKSEADLSFYGRAYIEKVTALLVYRGKYKELLYQLKYKGNVSIGIMLGKMLGNKLFLQKGKKYYVVPVPLHWRKQMKRGYNQSTVLAKGVIKSLRERGIEARLCEGLLKRRRFTETQTVKDRLSRWQNVQKAFTINPHRLRRLQEPLHFLLIDDVLTTGATLDACANLLLQNCRCTVTIATAAFVP